MAAVTEGEPIVRVDDVTRAYGPVLAVDGLTLTVSSGEIHAVLGRNGAGKTTLLRILAGLVTPTSGRVRVATVDVASQTREARELVGLVPSGDRSFYLRLSALENLVFFGRLHGLHKSEARRRALAVLADVGLASVASRPMSTYSHGMQKRVSVARALLTDPPVLLVDEATHDLDPDGAQAVRTLVRDAAGRGCAVLWATQRVEEVRGFADRVTLIEHGRSRFSGTVSELVARAGSRRFVVSLGTNGSGSMPSPEALDRAVGTAGRIVAVESDGTYLLSLAEGCSLGDALGALLAADVQVVGCRYERPEVEEAFLAILAAPGGEQ